MRRPGLRKDGQGRAGDALGEGGMPESHTREAWGGPEHDFLRCVGETYASCIPPMVLAAG